MQSARCEASGTDLSAGACATLAHVSAAALVSGKKVPDDDRHDQRTFRHCVLTCKVLEDLFRALRHERGGGRRTRRGRLTEFYRSVSDATKARLGETTKLALVISVRRNPPGVNHEIAIVLPLAFHVQGCPYLELWLK